MKNLFLLFTILLGLNSCNSWLDVQPYDRVAEDVVFESVKGFENALNGIYIELNTNSLYGQYLSCEMIEIMAQRYSVNKSNAFNYDLMLHKYTEQGCKARFASIWKDAYSLIANINLLLKNCESHRNVLTDEYYNLLKGECYALRAFLHFVIFRLFGPVYDLDVMTVNLPYYKEFSLDKRPSCKPDEFMNCVIEDLHRADSLLQDDPVLQEGTDMVHDNAFVSYRKYRLNKYGVQLLLARAELYRGNKEAALVAARKVIDAQEQWFPWVTREAVSSGRSDPDRVFYPEILWGLQNFKLSNLHISLFGGENLSPLVMLAPLGGQIDKIFENNRDDYRYEAYFRNRQIINGASYNMFEKFKATQDTIAGTIIPLLRMSEAFYIAAECEPNASDGLVWLNQVLTHRGVRNVTNERYLASTLEKEYIREFWGEGQLFFYYKRLKYPSIHRADDATYNVMKQMTLSDYQLLIPEEESKYN